ncbi:MAG: extracellular solute-binding protein, partial [Oscillospiraceae bacterium]|nr:extracellular solute-binding protein [Oscillospiraceae bacterium]
ISGKDFYMNFKKTISAVMAITLAISGMTLFPATAENTDLFGDMNGDNAIDASDATLVLKYSAMQGAGSYNGTLEQFAIENGFVVTHTNSTELFGDINNDKIVDASDATLILQYSALYGSGQVVGTLKQFLESLENENNISDNTNSSIKDDGDMLTIVSWNDNDLKNMIEVFQEDYPDVNIRYLNCGASSGNGANASYQTFLNSDEDIDLFIAESGWILNYINDDSYSAPLSELDITQEDYTNAYAYTVDIGTDSNGVLKGASWQAAPGGYCYNADLAKEYLGIETPEEMQEKISDWDKFAVTGAELAEASNGYITIAASLDDMWQCFSTSTNSPWLIDGKINTQTAREFTEMIIPYIQNESIDSTVSQWGQYDWMVLGKDEETLGYFFSTWCLTKGNQLEQCCGTEGNWRIVKGPQEYFWGGSWLCLSPKCDNKTDASNFVKYFTLNADSMEKYALKSGDFVNNQTVMEKIVTEGSNSNELLGGQDQFAVLKDVAANIKLNETITQYDEDLKLSLRYALHAESIFEAVWENDIDAVINQFLEEAKSSVPEDLFPDE